MSSLIAVLEKFGFGKIFIEWIKLLRTKNRVLLMVVKQVSISN